MPDIPTSQASIRNAQERGGVGVGEIVLLLDRGLEIHLRSLQVRLEILSAHLMAGTVDRDPPTRESRPVMRQIAQRGIALQRRDLVAQPCQPGEIGCPRTGSMGMFYSRTGRSPSSSWQPL